MLCQVFKAEASLALSASKAEANAFKAEAKVRASSAWKAEAKAFKAEAKASSA